MSIQNATAPKPTSLKAAHVRIDELEKLLKGVKTINPSDLDAAHVRIDELEEKANTPHKCKVATLAVVPQTRQYTGRVTMPNYGIPLPEGVGFHGYVSTRLEDDIYGDLVVSPTEDDVLAILRLKAENQFPGHVNVEVSDISVLPADWRAEEEEE